MVASPRGELVPPFPIFRALLRASFKRPNQRPSPLGIDSGPSPQIDERGPVACFGERISEGRREEFGWEIVLDS